MLSRSLKQTHSRTERSLILIRILHGHYPCGGTNAITLALGVEQVPLEACLLLAHGMAGAKWERGRSAAAGSVCPPGESRLAGRTQLNPSRQHAVQSAIY